MDQRIVDRPPTERPPSLPVWLLSIETGKHSHVICDWTDHWHDSFMNHSSPHSYPVTMDVVHFGAWNTLLVYSPGNVMTGMFGLLDVLWRMLACVHFTIIVTHIRLITCCLRRWTKLNHNMYFMLVHSDHYQSSLDKLKLVQVMVDLIRCINRSHSCLVLYSLCVLLHFVFT